MADRQKIVDALLQTWPVKMGRSIVDALTLPGDVYAGRTPMMADGRTNPEVINRSADLGGLVMGGTYAGAPAKAAGEAAFGAGPIRAYHGSPHDFDRFDLSKIGTGEGAQAYGHGLYFAENPATAQAYRDQLAPRGGFNDIAEILVRRAGGDWQKAAEKFAADLDKRQSFATAQGLKFTHPQYDLDLLATLERGHPGHMYEVNIHADPNKFLDWDKPLAKMGEPVRKALNDAWLAHPDAHANMEGASIYGAALRQHYPKLPSHEAAARATGAMREAGIPGIKYLDQGSRAAGDGSRNYVVFDDKLVEILRKYGLFGLGMLPLAQREGEL